METNLNRNVAIGYHIGHACLGHEKNLSLCNYDIGQ